MLVELKAWF